MPSEKLSPQEARVRKLLVKKRDTTIKNLFSAAKGNEHRWRGSAVEFRQMHQAVGAIITRLNQKIAADGVVAKVGKARGTYRLYSLTA